MMFYSFNGERDYDSSTNIETSINIYVPFSFSRIILSGLF